MSIDNPLEKMFAFALKQAGIPFEYQKPVGQGGGYCASQFDCRCDDYDDYDAYGAEDDCRWYVQPYTKYFIDFFVPIGRGLAIELDGSYHSLPVQQRKDAERQRWIERECGYRVVRLSSQEVFAAQRNGLLIEKCKSLLELAAQQARLEA